VHILSTGDELAEPGTARERADAIPESVSFGVAALAAQWGAECIGRTRVRDELAAMQALACAAIDDADLVVVTGGASVGEKDFAKAMFEPLGLHLVFSKVSIKPGKPVWLGRAGEKLVIGLPGNPTSALVTARLFLAPLLAGLTGRPGDEALRWRTVPLGSPLGPCGSRETFHRARWVGDRAEILAFQDSSSCEQGLDIAQRSLAGGRIADVPDRRAAGQPAHDVVAIEIAGDVAHRPVRVEMLAIESGDSRRFLAPMLKGMEAQRDEARRIVGTPDAEDAALLAQLVVVERIGRQHQSRIPGCP